MLLKTAKESDFIAQDSAAFYDGIAPGYDAMTNFRKRFVQEKPFFNLLVQKYGIRTALDAGAGTGFHSLLLAQLGVQVASVDVSQEMLKRVKSHAREMHLEIKTFSADFKNVDKEVPGTFDAVISMGNSLAHVLSHEELRTVFRNFMLKLNTGGILFLQMLNYEKILAERKIIQSVKEAGDTIFVRYYEFHHGLLNFNILALERKNGVIEHALHTTLLRPVVKDEVLSALADAGFAKMKIAGSISMDEFQPMKSKDLVVLAQRE
ncbi:MAG: class I SAM-dependent methyltransferase [Bacteroidota bacterium]|nr:class I SAM-dependent methyltransferase [Bacteroidota bacterium]